MKIKNKGYNRSVLNTFDLLGTDEVGLSKVFAFLLGKEPKVLYKFLHYIGVKTKFTNANYRAVTIEIERVRDEGRTDIEIKQTGKFHVIIESKIRKGRVKAQREKYITSFDNVPQKIMCFITQERDFNKQIADDVQIRNMGWLDVINLFDNKSFFNRPLVNEFLSFAIKGFKMKEQKEILIQDLSDPLEIKRYREFHIYRRDITFGSPLYFSPYFTSKAKQPKGEGISFLSKILGILTLTPNDIRNFEDDLHRFTSDKQLVKKWIKGVELDLSSGSEDIFTYFFLAEPLDIPHPLKKDSGKKGSGKGWIALMIPKNRCVTFEEFTKRLLKQNTG